MSDPVLTDEALVEQFEQALFAHTAYGPDPRARLTGEECDALVDAARTALLSRLSDRRKDSERIRAVSDFPSDTKDASNG